MLIMVQAPVPGAEGTLHEGRLRVGQHISIEWLGRALCGHFIEKRVLQLAHSMVWWQAGDLNKILINIGTLSMQSEWTQPELVPY